MLGMLENIFIGKKTSDALVCKGKCIGIMIGLAAGVTVGYLSALCIAPSAAGAKLRKKIASCGNKMMDKVLKGDPLCGGTEDNTDC